MPDWRGRILEQFTPQVSRLTLVADPDGLLLEEMVQHGIRERGFELIPFEDHVAFRFAYESRFRERWDNGEMTDLVVVLRSPQSDLRRLPYDLLKAGRKLAFSLSDLFPQLSCPVVASLDRGDLDALYEAQVRNAPGKLGDNATRDFVLRCVFRIDAELMGTPAELLRMLLRRHYLKQRIPKGCEDRLVQSLKNKAAFSDWPLDVLVRDREAFFAFLQERWPLFLDRVGAPAEADRVDEPPPAYNLQVPGPAELPFEHEDVRVFVDNLFLEGFLKPVPHPQAGRLTAPWMTVGVLRQPRTDHPARLARLLDKLDGDIPREGARYQDWLAFAPPWAQAKVLQCELAAGPDGKPEGSRWKELSDRAEDVRRRADRAFCDWIRQRFGSLYNLPATPPVMLHHVPRMLAHYREEHPAAKLALVVLDGMALDQWLVLRDELAKQVPALRFREEQVFAWVPTLTTVCRQAVFAGRAPFYFASSINTTGREDVLWAQFWLEHGLSADSVAFAKNLGEETSSKELEEILSGGSIRVAGLIVDKIDKIMHGMKLGTAGMHNQVRLWSLGGFLARLLERLLGQGFKVFLTSDHGNVEAVGCGRPSERVTADLRGVRARVYPNTVLRGMVKGNFPDALEWPPLGLPEDYLALLAGGRAAFVDSGEQVVAHGGASIEEVIVPLVQIEEVAP